MQVRDAQAADAAAITAIYNHYVLNTAISFEEEAVSAADMAYRIADVQAGGLPWLVAESGGAVVAYAYATKWRVRHAYRFSVESSVYVACLPGPRLSLGKMLYRALIARLRRHGVHLVIGGIALPNEASVGLHEAMGYVKAAHFAEVGRKFGHWIDVGYWQLRLA
ncbi:N-acetyltransferase family protein [Massilia sp. B-10]|nr:N-acetyltransferase family protein [Massilia sp. B-10]